MEKKIMVTESQLLDLCHKAHYCEDSTDTENLVRNFFNKKLKKVKKPVLSHEWIGKSVFIKAKDHPHAGEKGEVKRYGLAGLLKKNGWVVENEHGQQFYVFNSNEMEILETK